MGIVEASTPIPHDPFENQGGQWVHLAGNDDREAATLSVSLEDVLDWIRRFQSTVEDNKVFLTQLDAAIGDADHGTNMARGMKAVLQKLDAAPPADIGSALKTSGMALLSSVGGAGGPLYGTLFMQMGAATTGKSEMDVADFAAALKAGLEGVVKRGKAEPGDKTMVDALTPASEALERAAADGATMSEAMKKTVEAARQGVEATIPLVARKGRASYLGERSAGHQDPGATSSFLLLETAEAAWGG